MKSNLLPEFSVNKENNSIHLAREFNASLELVWKAWTTADLLDRWWGPQPWRAETKTMDFREGGFWHYAMVGPEVERHWSKAHYISIADHQSFSARDGFCDENGLRDSSLPENLWENTFTAKGEVVKVEMLLTFDNPSDLEKIIEMGFKEGITHCLQQLDELLTVLQK